MIKPELFSKYGIKNVYDREDIIDDLFSFNEYDPMLEAESHGYDVAEGLPFITTCSFGPANTCLTTIIVFKDYKSKLSFENNKILTDL